MSYPPPPGGPPPPGYGSYGTGGGGYAYPVEHPQGTTILVLGILGLVICQVLGPVAWVMGNSAMAEIDANPAAYSNRGSIQAGRICGIIATVLTIAIVAFVVLALVLAPGSEA
ncbi:hypothetical protein BH23ACT2_BH23ACT2_06430 [soil metagenome]